MKNEVKIMWVEQYNDAIQLQELLDEGWEIERADKVQDAVLYVLRRMSFDQQTVTTIEKKIS